MSSGSKVTSKDQAIVIIQQNFNKLINWNLCKCDREIKCTHRIEYLSLLSEIIDIYNENIEIKWHCSEDNDDTKDSDSDNEETNVYFIYYYIKLQQWRQERQIRQIIKKLNIQLPKYELPNFHELL